jgi:hypothetical protein
VTLNLALCPSTDTGRVEPIETNWKLEAAIGNSLSPLVRIFLGAGHGAVANNVMKGDSFELWQTLGARFSWTTNRRQLVMFVSALKWI